MRLIIDSNDLTYKSKEVAEGVLNTEFEYVIIEFDNRDVIRLRLLKDGLYAASFYVKNQKYRRTPVELINTKIVADIVLRSLDGDRNWEDEIKWHEEIAGFNGRILAAMKPKRIDNHKIINIIVRISQIVTIVLSLWACVVTFFFIGDDFYIQLNADGYKPAVFTIKELRFYKAYTDNSRLQPTHHFAHYFAYGEIAGNKERFGLTGFIKELIESQADLEKEFSVGQKLQVLYNPDIPKKFDIQIQYPDKDFKKVHKRRQMQMIRKAYRPWAIAFCLSFLLGVLTKKKRSVIFVTLMSLGYMGFPWVIILIRYYAL